VKLRGSFTATHAWTTRRCPSKQLPLQELDSTAQPLPANCVSASSTQTPHSPPPSFFQLRPRFSAAQSHQKSTTRLLPFSSFSLHILPTSSAPNPQSRCSTTLSRNLRALLYHRHGIPNGTNERIATFSLTLRPANVPWSTLTPPTSHRATTEAAILSKVSTAVEATISNTAMCNSNQGTSRLDMYNTHHHSRRVITKQWSTALLVL
jgi:hypothetical protein